MRLAVDNSPVLVAWAAYDEAALKLHGMYAAPEQFTRLERMAQSQVTALRQEEWRRLFVSDQPRPAA